jgi:nitrate/nitrite transporter NarK
MDRVEGAEQRRERLRGPLENDGVEELPSRTVYRPTEVKTSLTTLFIGPPHSLHCFMIRKRGSRSCDTVTETMAMSTRNPPLPRRFARVVTLLSLLIAGEAVFGLPFHVARFFRPTLLRVLGVSNAELGTYFAAYGVLAMLSYLPGGVLADHFSARKLLTASLVATGFGGLYFATLPESRGLVLLFALFGVSTILPFWAALIRATRRWGGQADQGKAFGILDGGRGLFAAALASMALWPFELTLGGDASHATDASRLLAIQRVIHVYAATTFAAAALVWFVVPDDRAGEAPERRAGWGDVREVLVSRKVWLQALIVVCAYSAYKGLDNYGLFAVDAYGMDEIAGARVSVLGSWLRPVTALGAGLLADRIQPSKATLLCFGALLCGYASFVGTAPGSDTVALLWLNVAITSASVFGLRGVYFALLEESRVPARITGTSVGAISLVGFTPDVFIAPVSGALLDASPGAMGHKHVFVLLGALCAAGLVATMTLRSVSASERQ